MTNISRRDFLKFAAAVGAGALLSPLARSLAYPLKQGADGKPNIIILLLDALSAQHLSLYGYARSTTPNLDRFAERATVYHSHYAGGNFTTPGTASMLTGLYPWRHRAMNQGGLVRRELDEDNLFSFLGDGYYRLGYTQNIWAQLLLGQFRNGLDHILPISTFSHRQSVSTGKFFSNDPVIAYYAYEDLLASGWQAQGQAPGSLSIFLFDEFYRGKFTRFKSREYPLGLPFNQFYDYKLNETFDGIRNILISLEKQEQPFLAYFHLWAPHEPSSPRRDFIGKFNGQSAEIPSRPIHPLSQNVYSGERLAEERTAYDEYIANVDSEFGRLLDLFEEAGTLDRSYLVVTSDHGQLFERGQFGHVTPLLYEGVTRIPLLISAPGQSVRQDIRVPISNTDLLPTILHWAGREIPAGLDGRLLPGQGGAEDFERPIISIEAKESYAIQPLGRATIAMVKGAWKLIHYLGYPDYPASFEMYNLFEDAFERNDLFPQNPAEASSLKDELLSLLADANRPFMRE